MHGYVFENTSRGVHPAEKPRPHVEKARDTNRHTRCSIACRSVSMDWNRQDVNAGFDRLQELLLAMRAGDEMCASDAARLTGLSREVCRSVFEGLKRAGLMTHGGDDRFIRKTLDVTAL